MFSTHSATVDALKSLDTGKYSAVIELIDEHPAAFSGCEGALLQAEVAAYRYRIEEACAHLVCCDALTGSLALRRDVLAAEVAMLEGCHAEAAELFGALTLRARREGDPWVEVRARVDRARAARMLAKFEESVRYAREAADLADLLEATYYAGIAAFNLGAGLWELGAADAARLAYAEAIERLEETERSRVWALALNALAQLDAAEGAYDSALRSFDRAAESLLELGSAGDLRVVEVGRAWTLYAGGHYEAAAAAANRLIVEDRAAGDARAELFDLRLAVSAMLALDQVVAAVGVAAELRRLADAVGSEVDRAEAELCGLRALVASGAFEQLTRLDELVVDISSRYATALAPTAALLYADALRYVEPLKAWNAFRTFDRRPGPGGLWYQAELAALRRAWQRQGLWVDNGELRISLGTALPHRRLARAVLDAELLRAAIESADGNLAAAGRMLGEKRWNASRLARELGVNPSTGSR